MSRLCPSVDELMAFAMGRSTTNDANTIEKHLSDCPNCIAILNRSGVADPLVAAVRAAGYSEEDSADRALAERLKAANEPAKQAETTDLSIRASTANYSESVLWTESDATEEAVAFLKPPVEVGDIGQLGPYRVLGILGRGGMGMVFRARDSELQRPVALKVMRPRVSTSPAARLRFLAEARAAAQLRHDHVVTVYQVGEDLGVPYLAMELLDGESLDDRLEQTARLSTSDVCKIGRETALALAAAHAIGLVHRDIKPANLWLDKVTGRTKVLDFGLARATNSEAGVTASGMVVGTPAYMAPEQAQGEPVDGRSDLFALGVTLYRMATGKLPFVGPDPLSTLLAVTTVEPPAPQTLCPDVPSSLSDLIMRLLAKDRAARPQSATEVADSFLSIGAAASRNASVELPTKSRTSPPQHRRPVRVALASGLAALAVFIAGVIIIVRDKDGKKIAEFEVPGGQQVGIQDKNGKTLAEIRIPEGPASGANPDRAGQNQDSNAGPISIPAPPPLAEWMKGRTVRTVAQDGTGEFKTIQAALKAVRPGEVVKVLDKGPYRERLQVERVRDVGLVSEKGATIELTEWVMWEMLVGHSFTWVEGFRLHGIHFHFPNDDGNSGIRIGGSPGFVLENCHISCLKQNPLKQKLDHALKLESSPDQKTADPLIIRNCRIGVALGFTLQSEMARVLVERNHFTGSYEGAHLGIAAAKGVAMIVRHNVFDDAAFHGDINTHTLERLQYLEISNNIFTSRSPISFHGPIAPTAGKVVIRNNIHARTYLAYLVMGAEKSNEAVARNWIVDHNAYAEPTTNIGWSVPMADVPKGKGDIFGPVKFLSNIRTDPNYMRLSTDDPHAKSGAGGEWPTYMGALPPGPPPEGGDWFTEVRKKWADR